MRGEFIEVGGSRLYYYAAGTRGNGEPIVLVHGFPTSGHVWSDLVPLLPEGRRVVIPDLLGLGRSDHAGHEDLTLGGHATRLIALMDELRIQRAALVGHHAGAMIVARAAAMRPGRTTHLAFICPLGGDVTFAGTIAVLRAFLPIARLLPARTVGRWLRRELLRWYADPDRGRLAVDRCVRMLTDASHWPTFFRQVASINEEETLAITESLRNSQVPAAIVAGEDDPAVPRPAVEALIEAMPEATLDIIRGSRHFVPEESPEQVARVIERLLRRG